MMVMPRRFAAAVLALTMLDGAAAAQPGVLTYAGPDRAQRIVEGAKKEGTVTLYSSATVADMNP